MVQQLQVRARFRRTALTGTLVLGAVSLFAIPHGVRAEQDVSSEEVSSRAPASSASTASAYLEKARAFYSEGNYFRAARYAFAAIGASDDAATQADAYSWVSTSLVKARLYNSASYFFIKTLQSGSKPAIRRALYDTQNLLVNVGGDLLRKYLIRHTNYDDYDTRNRSAYLYSLGKEALLTGNEEKAIGYLNGISPDSPVFPFALQLRGSAYAIRGNSAQAVEDFRRCISTSGDIARGMDHSSYRYRQALSEADDLAARCRAGEARSYYQADQFDAADRAYDKIEKSSLVWPDILFEQAWNSFARREYNRTLGKLVSYKSPALSFVFNPETDVLRAQSFLALCLYSDANQVINEFNGRYAKIGEEVKGFVESNSRNLEAFYRVGKNALHSSIYSNQDFNPMLNRFVRGPYFSDLVRTEGDTRAESEQVQRFASMTGASDPGAGFPGFLNQVLAWRQRSVRILGGMFVKNSLIDYHSQLISDFEKMAFIKLEMLKRAKDQLIYKNHPPSYDRSWGNEIPTRRDYQYYWTFNGEFWNDELGDYVFGLESECKNGGSSE